jgi:hypothetical protein
MELLGELGIRPNTEVGLKKTVQLQGWTLPVEEEPSGHQ